MKLDPLNYHLYENRGNSPKDFKIDKEISRSTKELLERSSDRGFGQMEMLYSLTVNDKEFTVQLVVYIDQLSSQGEAYTSYNCKICTKMGDRFYSAVTDGKIKDWEVISFIQKEASALVYPAYVREYELKRIDVYPKRSLLG